MANGYMNIKTIVQIDKDYISEFKKDDCIFTQLCAFHISIDPITKEKICIIFSDDGKGNGTPIVSFGM